MENVRYILQSIRDYKGFKSNYALARFLGVSRSTLSNWIVRGTLDEKLILSKIPEIRVEFLRTGEKPITEQGGVIQFLLRKIGELEKKIEELEKKHGKD